MDYQYGGTLPVYSKTYVERQADKDLYRHLKSGNFCYVLSARQMGKSSLRARIMDKLKQENYQCVSVDLSVISSEHTDFDRWCLNILWEIAKPLELNTTLDLNDWWKSRQYSAIQKLTEFIELVIRKKVSKKLIIFIDEIDSIINLKVNTDDFFAFIRACFNRKVDNPEFEKVSFVLLGVATPSDLIKDQSRTPFNIGKAIELTGFQIAETTPLMNEVINEKILVEIFKWTGGQPFLTQKLCAFAYEKKSTDIDYLVKEFILKDWHNNDHPEHLRTIEKRLTFQDPDQEKEQNIQSALNLYKKILGGDEIKAQDVSDNRYLQLSGLVTRTQKGLLEPFNKIYLHIFNIDWVDSQIRPYSKKFWSWKKVDNELVKEKFLLISEELDEAKRWAKNRRITQDDYDFIQESKVFSEKLLSEFPEYMKIIDIGGLNVRIIDHVFEAYSYGLSFFNQIIFDNSQSFYQSLQQGRGEKWFVHKVCEVIADNRESLVIDFLDCFAELVGHSRLSVHGSKKINQEIKDIVFVTIKNELDTIPILFHLILLNGDDIRHKVTFINIKKNRREIISVFEKRLEISHGAIIGLANNSGKSSNISDDEVILTYSRNKKSSEDCILFDNFIDKQLYNQFNIIDIDGYNRRYFGVSLCYSDEIITIATNLVQGEWGQYLGVLWFQADDFLEQRNGRIRSDPSVNWHTMLEPVFKELRSALTRLAW